MDLENARFYLQVINLLGTALVGVWLYLEKRSDKTNERIDDLSERHDELDKRVTVISGSVAGSISHGDLEKVYNRLNDMDAKLNALIGETRWERDTLKLLMSRITERGLS